jgi:hypothetical protein
MSSRQQLLVLWPAGPTPASPVCAWSRYDGTGAAQFTTGDADEPPYPTVQAALEDGWRIIQFPESPRPPAPGAEHATGLLPYQYVLEQIVEVGS